MTRNSMQMRDSELSREPECTLLADEVGRPINEREFSSSLPTNAEANFSQCRCLDDEISNRTDYEIDMKQTIN